ncbi:MAG: tyrosine-type recombinase/integrase [Frisingicoccus sp.]|uniref:tyrosine-type recombinase/integrase n=1 Tax=Frisingicoccus sp. TaxID=1918627 RepID=UPI0026357BC2|nr:tyrosine-type recombinase/integrase [Frisingicoccus sp.]MDD6232187.1 tyrosine-type recombinase/integrase [Frisingicoccus sp.]MDY4835106.1 tyrosine-type recombinase/integrase [Frisingicoccus sp.]
MEERKITDTQIQSFHQYLIREEKSRATVEKYLRDVRAFDMYAGEQIISKEVVMAWKKELQIKEYAVRSINSMLASLNSLLDYLGWSDCKVKSIKQQRQIYCAEEKELSRAEYMRLLKAAENKPQLQLVMKTICGTGIRVSELKFFTVENVKQGEVTVNCKAKSRTVLIPGKLRKLLLDYSRKEKIHSGVIFINRNGEPLNRSCIWAQMKSLCEEAGVNPGKVFPHNLRKLFARTFYGIEKDIAKLADILGHSSIDTTRIYIMTTGTEHRRIIERLGLVV